MKKNIFKSVFGQNDVIGSVGNEAFSIMDTYGTPKRKTEKSPAKKSGTGKAKGASAKSTAKKSTAAKTASKKKSSSEKVLPEKAASKSSNEEMLLTMDEMNQRLDASCDCNDKEDLSQGSEFR